MSGRVAGEDEIRGAIRSAYQFESGYPDFASINRIVGAIGVQGASPNPGRIPTLIFTLAVMALSAAVIGTLLLVPRGAAPIPGASAAPVPRTLPVPLMSISLGVGGGTITFQGHELPAGSRVEITVTQAAVSTKFVAVADPHGDAEASAADPGLAPGFADSSICVMPSGQGSAAEKCFSSRVQVPAPSAASATTSECPPGSRQVGQSTPGPSGNRWVSCLSTASTP